MDHHVWAEGELHASWHADVQVRRIRERTDRRRRPGPGPRTGQGQSGLEPFRPEQGQLIVVRGNIGGARWLRQGAGDGEAGTVTICSAGERPDPVVDPPWQSRSE